MNIRTTSLLALALIVTPFTAVAATITVDQSSCTLSDAMLAANTDLAVGGCTAGAGADTLVLNADITLSTADTVNSTVVDGAYAGLPDVTSDITIEAGTANLIERDSALGCTDPEPVAFRIFNVFGSGVALTLDGVTVQNACINGLGGAISVRSGASLSIQSCSLTNNQALDTPTGNTARGGAIYVYNGSLSVTSSTISDNRATEESVQGGAICVYSGTVGTLDGNTFSNNTAKAWDNASGSGSSADGGAVYLNVNATSVSDNTFTGNVAQGGGGSTSGGAGSGGAFFQLNGTIATMSNNIFTANEALGGSGGTGNGSFAQAGAFHEENVTIFSNNLFNSNLAHGGDSASADGGNAYAGAVGGSGSSNLYDTVTFLDNSAIGGNGAVNGGLGEGGALDAYWLLSNSSFSGNTAQGGDGVSGSGGDALGGAWYIGEEYASNHVTVAGNQAIAGSGTVDGTAAGGGIYIYRSYGFYLSNCIIADNTVTPAGGSATDDDCGWGLGSYDQSGGYNFIEAPGNCVFTYAPSDITGVDPVLDSLVGADCLVTLSGGSCVETWALSSTSPAIDAGSCGVSGAMVDQRGYVRPFDDPGSANVDDACDPGAFEWTDVDSDGAEDGADNCPGLANPDQEDADFDGVGDACDLCEGDDATGDGDSDGICFDRDCDDGDGLGISCWLFGDGFESGDVSAW